MYTESQNTETDLESHLKLKMHNTRIGYTNVVRNKPCGLQATWTTSSVEM